MSLSIKWSKTWLHQQINMDGGNPYQTIKGSERRPFINFSFGLNIVVSDLHQVDELSLQSRKESKKFQLPMSKASERSTKIAACHLLCLRNQFISQGKCFFI